MNSVKGNNSIVVSIYISAEDYLCYYRGEAKTVSTIDVKGRRVQFPANILQRFVTAQGIRGVFEIYFDSDGKFSSVSCLSDGRV